MKWKSGAIESEIESKSKSKSGGGTGVGAVAMRPAAARTHSRLYPWKPRAVASDTAA